MSLPPLIYQGSVKNIRGIKGVAPYIFEYSNRYSVFDWGAMPDELDEKGESLAYMAWMFFDMLGSAENWKNWKMNDWGRERFQDSAIYNELKKNGVKHHCLGPVDEKGNSLSDENILSKNLAVKPVAVMQPLPNMEKGVLSWDYSYYQKRPISTLVPLEIIFRFGVPKGSSLLKRVTDPEYIKELGINFIPKEGDRFDFPIIEYSSKLETTDRYVGREEAFMMASLNSSEGQKLESLVTLLALRLKDIFKEVGIELWDGKFEFGFSEELDSKGNRSFTLVDSIGPDELRLTYHLENENKDIQLSKESIRLCYRDTEWFFSVEKAKTLAQERGRKDWKNICLNELKSSPPPLEKKETEKFSMMYKTLTNQLSKKYYGREIFSDTLDIREMASNLGGLGERG